MFGGNCCPCWSGAPVCPLPCLLGPFTQLFLSLVPFDLIAHLHGGGGSPCFTSEETEAQRGRGVYSGWETTRVVGPCSMPRALSSHPGKPPRRGPERACGQWPSTRGLPSHVLQNVGCDFEIDSGAVEDRCGVCHGNGSTCHTVSGTFEEAEGLGMETDHCCGGGGCSWPGSPSLSPLSPCLRPPWSPPRLAMGSRHAALLGPGSSQESGPPGLDAETCPPRESACLRDSRLG